MVKWRLLSDMAHKGSYNMAVDEALLQLHSEGKTPPTLRLYRWSQPTVSLGYFQDFHREIDIDGCKRNAVDYLRRPTGGRAVLHDNEVTYSVVIRQELLPGGVLETYRQLSQGLLFGLEFLGIKAELTNEEYMGEISTAACFDSPSAYELVVGGKKIIGSAQTRKQNTILQHGSFLLDWDLDLMLEVFNLKAKDLFVRTMERKATNLRRVCLEMGLDYPKIESINEALIDGFSKALNIELVAGELTAEEKELAQKLMQEKYEDDDWTYHKAIGMGVTR